MNDYYCSTKYWERGMRYRRIFENKKRKEKIKRKRD
jgi:hypothetical protein